MYFCHGIKESNLEGASEERIELKVPSNQASAAKDKEDSTQKHNPLKLAAPPPKLPPRPVHRGEPVMNPLTNPFLNMGNANTKIMQETEASVNANGNGSVVTTTKALPPARTAWATFD